MTTIPVTTKDLTPEWFTSMLELPENHQVKSVKLQPLGEKDSVSGYIYRAKLSYTSKTQETPKSLVLKMPRLRSQRTPYLLKAYIREVRFYQKLAPTVGIPVPKLIYADVDIETSDYILVLEDFPESTNVRNETGATQEQAYKLLENMAKLHAQYWEDPELSANKFLNNLENIMEIYSTDLPKCVPVFLSRFSQYIEPDDIAFIEALSEHFQDAVTPLLDSPQTLVHNDYAMKNILLLNDTDDLSAVLVDWANVGHGPGVRDLSFFIGTSIPTRIRIKYEFEFLRYYWNCLQNEGVSGYSLKRLEYDYRRAVVFDFVRTVHFGGREFFNSMYESIIIQDLRKRIGSVKELDLQSLL